MSDGSAALSRLTLLLCWLLLLHALGVYVFTRGFLLTRLELPRQSACTPPSSQAAFVARYDTDGVWRDAEQRWRDAGQPRRYVTAGGPAGAARDGCWSPRRFSKSVLVLVDALRFDFASEHLPIVGELSDRDPARARLFVFEADPPTTTLQRLKALVTGGMPTFVDFSANFDSDRLSEDNILHQLHEHNRSIVMMGDDTWLNLFPDSFERAFPYPSFNVKDLHTVDDGVLRHLMPELQRGDFDVLIAHFLGVDHIGHRFRADHPAMLPKLRQINDAIEDVVRHIDNETLLLVFGDHGMTPDGNHGGTAPLETDAALFMYSRQPLFSAASRTPVRVKQVDLVPTIALLMGVPIPFGSLGMVIASVFEDSATVADRGLQLLRRVEALRTNVWQVQHYLHEYAASSNIFEGVVLQTLTGAFLDADAMYLDLVTQHADDAADDTTSSSSYPTHVLEDIAERFSDILMRSGVFCREKWTTFDLTSMSFGLALFLATILLQIFLVALPFRSPSVSLQGAVGGALAGGVLALSYAFIVGVAPEHCLVSLLFCSGIGSLFGVLVNLAYELHLPRLLRLPTFSTVASVFIVVAYSSGLFSNSFIEREDRVVNYLLASLCLAFSFTSSTTSSSCLCVAIAVGARLMGSGVKFGPGTLGVVEFRAPLQLLQSFGSLCALLLAHASTQRTLAARLPAMVQGALIAAYWWLDTIDTEARSRFHDWLPRSVFALSAITIGVVVAASRRRRASHNDLALVFSALASSLLLLLGPRSAWVLLLAVAMLVALARQPLSVESLSVLLWLLGMRLFNATGHGTVFSSLQVSSAFVGFEEFHFYRSGALLLLNTFGGWLLILLGLAIICFSADEGKSDATAASFRFARCMNAISLLCALRALLSSVNAAIQRRHLMVWEIFAPKFVFECCAMFFVDLCLIIVSSVAYRLFVSIDHIKH